MDKIFTVVIVGPTASGKTSLGIEIAKRLNGEIVSADSMQIYKEMNIATAKPAKEEMQGIRHHMIDFLPADKSYSVALYKEQAMNAIYDIAKRNKLPIIVGGTGLYVDTLLKNTDFLQNTQSMKVRNTLMLRAENEGTQVLYGELMQIDPEASKKIHPNNTKKIIRALEIYYQTGKTLTEQNESSHLRDEELDPVIIGLNANDRQFLYDRINLRVDLMLKDGLIEEAKSFYSIYGVTTANQAIGYKELLPYLKGEKSLEEAVETLRMQTRRYAKRQLTWFRRNENINWLNIDELTKDELIQKTMEIIERRRGK